jgi:hypothetical protein
MLAAWPMQMVLMSGLADELHSCRRWPGRRWWTTPGVDVDRDALSGVLGLEEESWAMNQLLRHVIDGHAQEDDVVLEEPRVDVVRAFPAGGLLDHHRYKRHALLLDLNN